MVKCTGRGLVVKRPGVLSKVQMLNLVLGVGVFSLLPRKKRAHNLKKNPRDTGRVSLGHPAGQTGVYRPVSQGLPVIYYRKTDRKGHFCWDTGRMSQGHPAIQEVFRKFMWFFLMCLFCSLVNAALFWYEEILGLASRKRCDLKTRKRCRFLFRGPRNR